MGSYKPYIELQKKEKICPILSARRLVFSGEVAKCVGENCMWWEKCRPIAEIYNDSCEIWDDIDTGE